MSAFYASKVQSIAAAGEAHNEATRKRYPRAQDLVGALNTNIKLALVGEEQVMTSVGADWRLTRGVVGVSYRTVCMILC